VTIGKKIAGEVQSGIEKELDENGLLCKEVDDSDDFMGTNSWSIDRAHALDKTKENGAYGFWFDMPTANRYWSPECVTPALWSLANMRARIHLCLYREGMQGPLQQACSPFHEVTEPELIGIGME
jgi:hypothetical protein